MRLHRLGCAGALALLVGGLPGAVHGQGEAVRLLGEVRVRGEADRPAGLDSVDALTLLRSRIGLEATLSPRALVLLQLQDSRTFGEAASTMDGRAPRIDMHQAWLQYRADAGSNDLTFRVGRQQIALGNERLVGAVDWSNVGRSFDAARVAFGPRGGAWSLSTFAASVQERGRRFTGTQPARLDYLFVGAWLDAGAIDVFALHDLEATYRTFTGVDRTTLGGRVELPALGALTTWAEGSYQLGNHVTALGAPQDIRAYMFGGRATVATGATALPQLGLGLDWLSGDDDPTDGTYRAFNTLYATGHKWYGYLDLFTDPAGRTRDRGLVNGIASVRLGLPRELTLDIDGHGFWLQQQFAGTPDRMLGWELDFTLPISLGQGQRLQLGYSMFRNGAAAPLVGLGNDGATWHWAYIQAGFSFGGRAAPIL
jgi:hypothetical protein